MWGNERSRNKVRIQSSDALQSVNNSTLALSNNSNGSQTGSSASNRQSIMRKGTKKSISLNMFNGVNESAEAKRRLKERLTAFLFGSLGLMLSHCMTVSLQRNKINSDEENFVFGTRQSFEDIYLPKRLPKDLFSNGSDSFGGGHSKISFENGNGINSSRSPPKDFTRKRSISEGGKQEMKSNLISSVASPPKGADPLRSVQKTKTINLGDKNNLEAIVEEEFNSKKRNGNYNSNLINGDEEILEETVPKPQNKGTPGRKPGTVRGERSPEFRYKVDKAGHHPTNLNYGVFMTNDSSLKERLQDASVLLLPKNKTRFGNNKMEKKPLTNKFLINQ